MSQPIAGDFLSLLAARQLPALKVDAQAAPTQTQATTVFAFHFKDGVLMAGDRRATARLAGGRGEEVIAVQR